MKQYPTKQEKRLTELFRQIREARMNQLYRELFMMEVFLHNGVKFINYLN